MTLYVISGKIRVINDGSSYDVVVKAGSAILLEKDEELRACGAGRIKLQENEKILVAFNLKPQFSVIQIENVLTQDLIPLSIKFGVGYRIKPAPNTHSDNSEKIISDKQGFYPVYEKTLFKAAFSGGNTMAWWPFAGSIVESRLRDYIMAYKLSEIFSVRTNDEDPSKKTNERQVKLIEEAIKKEANKAGENIGVEVTNVDIREIHLPNEVRELIFRQIGHKSEITTNTDPTDDTLISKGVIQGRITTLKKQLDEWKRRLWKLEEQHAQQGINTLPHILTEIEDCQQKVAELETEFSMLVKKSNWY